MVAVLSYLALCLLPAAVTAVLIRLVSWFVGHERPAATTAPDPVPSARSLEALVATLRRLETDYAAVEASRLPARAHRLQAISLAYDDTLRECCLALEIPPPENPPLPPVERIRTEVELSLRGLTW